MSRRLVLGGTALAAAATLTLTPASASASPASVAAALAPAEASAPGKVANKLFRAWLAADRPAAAKVAVPAAVNTIFTYVYRAPDRFDGCSGNVCRFVHTSVRVPGGLNGIAMVVTGSKVTKVYLSRHIVKPSTVAKHLLAAWKRGDRYSGLEVGSVGAVKTLFRVRYDPHGVTHYFQGCSKEPKGYSCAYSYEGGAMLMHVRGSKTTGYEVRSITYIAD
ncbi:hypothetical protein [Nonomuraea basaltis]|uniref:hypothetical protein n=1 Tax=Nonomuraea basaltis TaxID=2495887 RepID=UPI00110C490E|nr:hypothetical protein [Nonomuraea basaltis]TMR90432.1 hypothetical protein EJK15_55440 [Nonomuraea basaltis]